MLLFLLTFSAFCLLLAFCGGLCLSIFLVFEALFFILLLWALDLLEVPWSVVPGEQGANQDDDLLLTGVVVWARLIHGIEGQLDVLRVARMKVIHDQVALGDVRHRQVGFRTLQSTSTVWSCSKLWTERRCLKS